MNKTTTFASIIAMGLAGLLGVSCDYEPDDTIGYESPTEYEFEEPVTEPADPIGEPDFNESNFNEPMFNEPEEPTFEPIEQQNQPGQPSTEMEREFAEEGEESIPEGSDSPDETTPQQ